MWEIIKHFLVTDSVYHNHIGLEEFKILKSDKGEYMIHALIKPIGENPQWEFVSVAQFENNYKINLANIL